MKRHRILVVDDSPISRAVLREILERDGDLQVVAEAADVDSACDLARTVSPDLVTMDVCMPGVGGLEGVARLMSLTPVPILVITALPAGPGSPLVFHALERGALDVLVKPSLAETSGGAALRAKVRLLAAVPVVVRPAPRLLPAREVPDEDRLREPAVVIGMAASTGGPASLARALADLAPDVDACVAIVQHLPAGLEPSFLSWVEQATALTVLTVDRPVVPRPGCVLVGRAGMHLVATEEGFTCRGAEPVDGHVPSGTVLFESLAQLFGPRSAGVVLSGAGIDGARGLLAIREAGGAAFVQAPSTAAMATMPLAALTSGAAPTEVPIAELGATLSAHAARHARWRSAGAGRAG